MIWPTISSLVNVSITVVGVWLAGRLGSYFLYRLRLSRSQAVDPPAYQLKDPIFGYDFFKADSKAFQSGTWLDLTFDLFLKYGSTFKVNSFGTTTIRTIDPEVSKCFDSTHFEDFGVKPLRWATAPYFFGPSITSTDGKFSAQRRVWLRPAFQRAHIANFERLGNQIDDFMKLLPADGVTFNLTPLFARYNLDTASDFIFGKTIDALHDPDRHAEEFRNAYTEAVRGIAIKQMLGNWLMYFHRDKTFGEARDTVWRHVDECVQEALQRREKRLLAEKSSDYVPETRLRLVDELAMVSQDPVDLRFQIISVFNPAHKLTNVVLTNVFFLLARHPKTYEQLRAEVLRGADQELTYDLLKSYKLVTYTIKETHRLFTSVAINKRQALRDTVLPVGGGRDGKAPLYIRKGSALEIHYRSMHRHQEIWGSDADEFRPERWSTARPGWAYLPFGGGPRYCVGQDLAFTEVAYMMVMMIRRFKRIENRDSEERWVEQMNMMFESKNGAKVALYRE